MCQGVHAYSGGDKDHQCKLQRVKNYTATIGVHDAASTCNLHKGMPLNVYPYPQFNIICPYASIVICAVVVEVVAVVVVVGRNNYCNLHCVMAVVVVFFLKQGHIY